MSNKFWQAGSYNSDSVSINLDILRQEIPATEMNASASLEILSRANLDLGVVFIDISTKASLDSLTPVLDVARFVELARYTVRIELLVMFCYQSVNV